ncbi:MAG TPA: EAL domain-containing response regulator [Usitatibacter sp.]|nr:EAL domain-containing response regulator [Usitatibacter sp.]
MALNREQVSELRFLVVEDQGFQRWAMGHMLETLGATRVFSAGDGQAALEIVRSLDPPVDIVLTDLNMPGMDGIEFIRHLGELAMPPALIVASEQDRSLIASVGTMARTYGVEVLDAIEKPVTGKKLAAALDNFSRRASAAERAPGPDFPVDEILHGIARDEFEPYFQAKVEVATGKVRGAEALARWRHPQHGIVLPVSFVHKLEAAAQIDALTMAQLAKASAACRDWRAAGFELSVAVNVSLVSLADISLADRVLAIVTRHGLDPRHVTIEVTETAAASHLGKVLENLSRLRMRGFGLSIDDYGTGYSSMQQLVRIPFTELKIDQSFVRNAPTQPSSRAMLESSLDMAGKLGIVSVAEGVESRQEMRLLAELGCPVAQGYYIARPMAANDFLRWLVDAQRGVNIA